MTRHRTLPALAPTRPQRRGPVRQLLLAALALLLAACGGGGGAAPTGEEAAAATGPITIWHSNNAEEIEWATSVVDAWNADHPEEQVEALEIPAGESSEEVITAAITAGNTPCLIYNTAPAAVPAFQRQGGLIAVDSFPDGRDFVSERVGDRAEQYVSPDGQLYQIPWKTNPSMIFYNKALFEQAGLDPENPPLATYEEFLETSRTIVESGAAQYAINPAPTSQFYQSWFDFYPLFIAASDGQQLVEDGEPQFTGDAGTGVAEFWGTLYEEGLAGREEYQGDAFNDGVAAMSIVGPWAIAVYEDVEWGVVPVPTPDGADEVFTFSDNKSVAMYEPCENRGTAWEFAKFSMSEENDGALLELTGQMPMRENLTQTYADYFEQNPEYEIFADQAARTVEVPNVENSVEMWQEFRDAWSQHVISGEGEPADALTTAAEAITPLITE
jgi:multiple sugar transport system substrate-binding protein